MIGAILKFAFLIQFIYLIHEVIGQSPCPNYFRYFRDETSSEIMGHIEIPSPPRGIALHLSVSMSVAIALPTKYVGRLKLAQSKEESVLAVQEGRSLQYRIHFPLRRPIPVLTGLWFNNQQLCSGRRAIGSIVTSIVLNHTLYPPGVLPLSENQDNTQPTRPKLDSVPQPPATLDTKPVKPSIIEVPYNQPGTTSTVDNVFFDRDQNNGQDCGRNSNTNNINLLIARGVKTSPGQWPWLAAIFIVKFEFEFQCAGTLLTNTHILTAAHCFHLDGINIPAGAMLVSLGRYRLRDWKEKGSVNREVAEYKFHPDYNTGGNADADLAILILRERVEYSLTIKPICLWSSAINLEYVVGKSGYVVGWGRDELGNPYTQEPRMSRIPIVSQEDCLWSNANFVTFTSNRTFCAGSRNGSGPCNGDSGSGLVIFDANTKRHHLRGVVSRSLFDSNNMSCDLKQYVVYVDVAKHLEWIRNQISA